MNLLGHVDARRHVSAAMQARVRYAAEGAGGRVLGLDFLDHGSPGSLVLAVLPTEIIYTGPFSTAECVHLSVDEGFEQEWFSQFMADGETDFIRLVCDVHDYFRDQIWLLQDAVAVPGGFVALRYTLGVETAVIEVVLRAPGGAGEWVSRIISLDVVEHQHRGTFWGERLLTESPHYLVALPFLTAKRNSCMNAMSHALRPAPIAEFMSAEDEAPFKGLMECNTCPDHRTFDLGYGLSVLDRMTGFAFTQEVFDLVADGRTSPLKHDPFTGYCAADIAIDHENVPALRAFARASTILGELDGWTDCLSGNACRPETEQVIRAEIRREQARMAVKEALG